MRIRSILERAWRLLALLAMAGCGTAQPDYSGEAVFGGELDSSLPEEQRVRQQAVRLGLEALREHGYDTLVETAPGVIWQESPEHFYEQGARLLKWDWAGPPEGNRFAVTLTLQKDQPGLVTVDQQKTYVVEQEGRRHRVTPVPGQ